MANSIIDSVMSLMGPQVLGPLASQLGVSTDSVQRGLQGGSAAILSGLAAKAGRARICQSNLAGWSHESHKYVHALSGLTSNFGSAVSGVTGSPLMEMGGRFLSTIFGPRLSAVTDAIGQTSGIGGGKASTLLSLAAPLVLGALGQRVRENNLTASGLASSLKSEAGSFQRFLPAGLGSALSGATGAVSSATTAAAGATKRWLWPVVLLAALLLAALWFFNRAKQPAGEAMNNVGNAISTTATNTAAALGDIF